MWVDRRRIISTTSHITIVPFHEKFPGRNIHLKTGPCLDFPAARFYWPSKYMAASNRRWCKGLTCSCRPWIYVYGSHRNVCSIRERTCQCTDRERSMEEGIRLNHQLYDSCSWYYTLAQETIRILIAYIFYKYATFIIQNTYFEILLALLWGLPKLGINLCTKNPLAVYTVALIL